MGQVSSSHDRLCAATSPEDSLTCGRTKLGGFHLRNPVKSSAEELFLKPHKPDRKCILDPTEVKNVGRFQADDIIRQAGISEGGQEDNQWTKGKDTDDGEASRFGAGSEFTGLLSEVAQSVITTGTSATKLMANLDSHYQVPKSKKQNNKFSVLVNVDVGHGISTLGMEGDEQEDKSVPGTIRESKNIQSIQNHGVERTRSTDAFQLYAHRLTACIGPADELQIRREACMSVLHLKMKAHLGPYYVYRYLPTIPDAPVPQGMSKPDDIPALVSDSSDDSSSSSGNSQAIGFGSIPPSTTIKCSITNSVFMDLSITGSLGLVPRHGHQVRKAPKPNQKSPDHYIVLMNRRSGVPIAVCALKAQSGLPIVRIYATKRRVYGQRPAASTEQLGLNWAFSVPLYAWAEIATEGLFPDPVRFSIYMASGSEGRFSAAPSYRAGLDVADGVPKIKMVGRTDMELRETGCAIISINADPDPENDNLFFNINASQGIDPALLICFAGVMDEVMEKSMRLQCQYHSSQSRRPRRIHSRAEF